jgi:hypothetical protein
MLRGGELGQKGKNALLAVKNPGLLEWRNTGIEKQARD